MFEQNLERANAHTSKQTGSEILKGVVVYVSAIKALQGLRENLYKTATELGATTAATVDACTHFIFKGQHSRSITKEFKEAESKKCAIVGTEWLLECQRAGERLIEQNFPYSYNPKKSLGGISASRGPSPMAKHSPRTPSVRSQSTHRSPQIVKEEGSEISTLATSPATDVKSPKSVDNEQTQNLKDAVTAFMKAHTKKPGRNRRHDQVLGTDTSRGLHAEAEPSVPDACSISAMERGERKKSVTYLGATSLISMGGNKESGAIMGEDDVRQSGASSNAFGGSNVDQDYDDDCSQAAVTYDDPDRDERQHLIEQLQSASVPCG